jgi:threonine dehydrogenase-like Zn-dependent dehydrogenase
VRIAAVGVGVESFRVGQRYLVETDYRWLPTVGSNGSFGYNFEGGLQEYVLMDERVITSPEGDSMLIPVSEGLSASAAALVEPWACVEDAYATKERRRLKRDGRMLVVAETELTEDVFGNLFNRYGQPGQITWVSKFAVPSGLDIAITRTTDTSETADASYDDVIYFGFETSTVEILLRKVAPQGLVNIVLSGGKFGSDVVTPVGRVHYGGIRMVGTRGTDPAASMEYIPETGEVRGGDKVNVIGAGGPMGSMHVIRNICQDIDGISVFAGDIDEDRLAMLSKVADPLAEKNDVRHKPYNSGKEQIGESFDYTVVMAPIPELVSTSVKAAEKGGIINIFAGIPADVTATIDLDAYIKKHLYFIGTSGSVLEDMKRVLAKVESGRLDTDVSVAAVCGLDGAGDGIRAVEKRQIAGKIMVYPACKGLGLIELPRLNKEMPEVGKRLINGIWNKEAEDALLEAYGKS